MRTTAVLVLGRLRDLEADLSVPRGGAPGDGMRSQLGGSSASAQLPSGAAMGATERCGQRKCMLCTHSTVRARRVVSIRVSSRRESNGVLFYCVVEEGRVFCENEFRKLAV